MEMLDPVWVWIARLTLALLFAAAGLSKLWHPAAYRAAIAAYALLPAPAIARRAVKAGFVAATLVALAVSPAVVTTLVAISVAAGSSEAEPKADTAACRATASFDALKALPPGLFLADIDAGPFLLAAPETVTNRDFSRQLARTLRRPLFLRAPSWALRLALGEMGEVLLAGQRATPVRLPAAGFSFRFPRLDAALADLLVAHSDG